MDPGARAIVHDALATQLGVDVEEIQDEEVLGDDLDMGVFDLLLVALRLEEQTPGRGELPPEALDPAMTVWELETVYAAWARGDDPTAALAPDTVRSPFTPPVSAREPG